MIEVRIATAEDRLLCVKWAADIWGHPAPQYDCFPSLGAVALVNGELQGMMWAIEFRDMPMAMVDFLATRRGMNGPQSRRMIYSLWSRLSAEMKRRGISKVAAQCHDARMVVECEKLGFASDPAPVLNLVKEI